MSAIIVVTVLGLTLLGGVDPVRVSASDDLANANLQHLMQVAGDRYEPDAVGTTDGDGLQPQMTMAEAFAFVAAGLAERGIRLGEQAPASVPERLPPVVGEFRLDEFMLLWGISPRLAGVDCERDALGPRTNARYGEPDVMGDPYPHLGYAESRIPGTNDRFVGTRIAFTTVIETGEVYSHVGHNTTYAGFGDFTCFAIEFFGLSVIWNIPAMDGVLAYDVPHLYTFCRYAWPSITPGWPPCPV